jgi:alcohol oxidase
LPIAKRLETYHLDSPGIDQSLHGHDGPINISFGTHHQRAAQDDILAAAESLGLPEVADLQDFSSNDGLCRMAKYIGVDGKRQDAAHCYIHSLLDAGKAPNLHLLVETMVSRVLFEDSRAVAVEVQRPGLASETRVIKAGKLVVVSAGALATPSILERSGVGKAELLRDLDIPVVSDLPGVGEEYQDHQFTLVPFKTNLGPEQTLDGIFSGRLDVAKAIQENNTILGWNAVDVGAKLRMSDEEVAGLGPEFAAHYARDFKPHPSKPIMMMGFPCAFFAHHLLSPEESRACQYMGVGCWSAYPYSRGSIHITSRDAKTSASFNTGFLSHPMDIKMHVFAYKKAREIVRRTNLYQGELAVAHPAFREYSKAALSTGPIGAERFSSVEERKAVASIEYDAEDDAAIEEFIRNTVQTTWHSMGTCKMAAKENGGVVDKNLSVHGTQGLKICGECFECFAFLRATILISCRLVHCSL